MSRLQAGLLLLASLAFTAAGAAVALGGGADDRAAGVATTVFFGACSVVFIGEFLPRRAPTPGPDGAVVIRRDRVRSLVLCVGGGLMAAGSGLLAPLAAEAGDRVMSVIGWIGAVFFGLAVPIGLWRIVRDRPICRLDAEGIAVLGGSPWSLAWRDIVAIDVHRFSGQGWLALRPRPAAPPLRGRMVNVQGSSMDFDAFAALVTAYWDRHRGW